MRSAPVHLPPRVVRRVVQPGGVAACVLSVYAAVAGAWHLVGNGDVTMPGWLGAAAAVALVVPLARPRLERLAQRLAYGEEGDAETVVRRFVGRIADALPIDDVLPDLARTASRAAHAPRGEVRLWLTGGGERRETWPPECPLGSTPVVIPLGHGGDSVGRLAVDLSPEDLTADDREMLERLAGPAGLALSNVRLTFELREELRHASALAQELQSSRERLLGAGNEQRRRFAAAVAERVDRRLGDIDTALAAVREGSGGDFALAARVTQESLDALREVARGVFPPALVDHGLAAAIELYLDGRSSRSVFYVWGDHCPTLPLRVRAAAYFCVVAIVDECPGHEPVTVRLLLDEAAVEVRVCTDLPPSGETEQLVKDRAEAAGGRIEVTPSGTEYHLAVHLPFDTPAERTEEGP